MRGHIVKRGKRYYAVVYEGTDPATGKRIRRWYAGGDTRKGAEKLLGELVKVERDLKALFSGHFAIHLDLPGEAFIR